MKILCVIDTISSGGAQKQMVHLACGLQERGHSVELFVYFPEATHFLPQLQESGVVVHFTNKAECGALGIIAALRGLLRNRTFDAAVAFLPGPCALLTMAHRLSHSQTRLILGERYTVGGRKAKLLRFLHMFADDIVANSNEMGKWLHARFWLRRQKIHVVYNGYFFGTEHVPLQHSATHKGVRLLVLARINSVKNGLLIAQALNIFYEKHRFVPEVFWAGRQEQDPGSLQYRSEVDAVLNANPAVGKCWHWLGERSDVPQLLCDSDALLHVTLYEGLPNAVCEAFIAGRPVIASNVCDHPILVQDGVRGFLCDPRSPESICAAIEQFVKLDEQARCAMGMQARAYANANLGLERMVLAYENILMGQAPGLAGDSTCAA